MQPTPVAAPLTTCALAAVLALVLSSGVSAAQVSQPFAPGSDVMTAPVQPGYFAHQKVVYQNSGGLPDDRAYFLGILRNMTNHLAATDGDVEIRVVNWGPGLRQFVAAKSDPELASAIDALRAKGVRFLMCRNTMRGLKLTPADLYKAPPEDIVPAGVAELARLEDMNYRLIHP